jgi:hypothetical protein
MSEKVGCAQSSRPSAELTGASGLPARRFDLQGCQSVDRRKYKDGNDDG